MTATRSPLDNRGYERSEHPRTAANATIDPKRVAHTMKGGTPSECFLCWALYPWVLATLVPTVNERRRLQRLMPSAISLLILFGLLT